MLRKEHVSRNHRFQIFLHSGQIVMLRKEHVSRNLPQSGKCPNTSVMLRKEHVSRNSFILLPPDLLNVMLRKEHVSRNTMPNPEYTKKLRYAPQGACE